MKNNNIHNQKCYANHMAPWIIEPEWFKSTLQMVKNGVIKAQEVVEVSEINEFYTVTSNGIAVISISGQIMKGVSKFGGTSSLLTRMALRSAMEDDKIKGIMFHIDSPGGTVAGVDELATDIARAAEKKIVRAHIDDLGASAALWIAAQASTLTANKMAQIGSIGAFIVLEDTSGKAEMEGIKVHVISSGPLKGAFADGAPITDAQLASVQKTVDDITGHFLTAISIGRGMDMDKVEALADGSTMIAKDALSAGLIDDVMSFEDAINDLSAEIDKLKPKGRNARARNILKLS